ncbi:SGNH/GDSL hydrolase family protein [Paenibacillus sp. CGMCC 1.16610]|uniref:Lysophospholipase n=1 Tax=Paenibacillus anseongense TaxID=2682845 RepID=A0ABW9U289_9BACL|nr:MULTISPECIES: SGNH/GDSL hydrolase family protein [Paenibacillus]MBA2936980.1 SGNH/GDSL hydrolase family protein [Paenibacillus sp. CGMCC 1.16610]MVQ33305.1 lysophospholipase [Paenibacillus anseongense]
MLIQGKPIDLLIQGDSITDAGRNRSDVGSMGEGYAKQISVKLSHELTESRPVLVNRGVSGNRVSDLYARWNEDAIYLQPKRLSLLIGVNDAWRIVNELPEGAANRFESSYRHLLDITKQYLPNTGLIICEPFILNCGVVTQRWEHWKSLISEYQAIVRNLADEYEALFVPLQNSLDEACTRADASFWASDGVHPTTAGHELIGGVWVKNVQTSKLALV